VAASSSSTTRAVARDDDTTVRIDEREKSLTAEAVMFIDSALMPVVRTRH
jgi:hypothetical protein